MSTAKKLISAAGAAAAGGATYVDDVFSTDLYLNDSSTSITINNGINLSENGGLIWGKRRDGGGGGNEFALYDTERGLQYELHSSAPDAQFDRSGSNTVPTATTTGCTTGNVSRLNGGTGEEQVLWMFRKQPGFFDIVTWDGNGTSGRAISHNLGSVPGMIIVKSYQHPSGVGNTDWLVYHRGLNGGTNPHNYGILLNTTGTENAQAWWNNTAPTSTQFEVNASQDINGSGGKYVAYLFAHDAQDFGENSDEAIIKCGSYTGNGSSSGVEVDLGFEPQWLFVKMTSHSGYYSPLVDSMRGFVVGGNDATVWPNVSDAEYSGANYLDPTSSGFIATDTANTNMSGRSYIYMAIRRPHKPASEFAATDLFAVNNGDGSTVPGFTSGFPVDMAWERRSNGTDDTQLSTRLLGETALKTNSDATEASAGSRSFDYMNGWLGFAEGTDWYSWMFRRAPGFFDVVAYTGNGVFGHMVDHNLGVVPEMIWIKNRGRSGTNWLVYHAGNTSEPETEGLYLNSGDKTSDSATFWHDTSPTATQFSAGRSSSINNQSGDNYIAYLFASVDGISKVGSYTATGSNINVDCGFSSGARFVLIKWASDTSSWYLWDSERGIVAGISTPDPYLQLNNSNAQATTTNWIDPLSSGFTVTSAAGNDVNNSGGEYIFYAIA